MLHLIMMSGLEIWLKIINSAKEPQNKNEHIERINYFARWIILWTSEDDKSKLFQRITAKWQSVKCKCWAAGTRAECVAYIKWCR